MASGPSSASHVRSSHTPLSGRPEHACSSTSSTCQCRSSQQRLVYFCGNIAPCSKPRQSRSYALKAQHRRLQQPRLMLVAATVLLSLSLSSKTHTGPHTYIHTHIHTHLECFECVHSPAAKLPPAHVVITTVVASLAEAHLRHGYVYVCVCASSQIAPH